MAKNAQAQVSDIDIACQSTNFRAKFLQQRLGRVESMRPTVALWSSLNQPIPLHVAYGKWVGIIVRIGVAIPFLKIGEPIEIGPAESAITGRHQ